MEGTWESETPLADNVLLLERCGEVGLDAEATTAWLDGLTASEICDALPQPQATSAQGPPECLPVPVPGFGTAAEASTQQVVHEKIQKRPAAKRVRQNAEAQRAYRRRKKVQDGQVVVATEGLQQYITAVGDYVDQLMSLVFDDEIIVERLMTKLTSTEAETVPLKGCRSFVSTCAQYARRFRRQCEAHQRQQLSLPGDTYIEGEIDALAWISREVNTYRKVAQEKAKWSQLALLPQAFAPHGGTVSDVLMAFVRCAAEKTPASNLRDTAEAIEQTSTGQTARPADKGCTGADDAKAHPELFNVSMAFRKLQNYLAVVHKHDALRYTSSICMSPLRC